MFSQGYDIVSLTWSRQCYDLREITNLFCHHKQHKHHSRPQSCDPFSQRHGSTALVGTLCMGAHNVSQMCLL